MKNYLRSLILFGPLMIGIVYGQNIGVGTNTPQEKLHVAGTLRVDDLQTSAPATANTDKVVWVDANGKVYSFPAGSAGKILGVNGAGLLAWLDPGLANTLNNGQIWIGDATNTPVAQTASGDALIDNAGVITIQDNAVDGTDISISAESNGSLMYFDGTNWVNLGVGSAGQILSISGGVPTWINPATAPTTGDLTTTTSGVTVTGGTGAVLGAGTSINVATNALGQNGLVTGPTIANPLEVWGTDALGNPSWVAVSSLLTTRNVLSGAGNNAVSITNGTNQVIGATDLTVNVATNALTQDGVVTGTTAANITDVWGTDASGVPAWRDPNALLTKNDILAGVGNNAISITNGTGQIVGGVNATVNVATNALNQAGVVTGTTAANVNQVWGTDALGNPAWITPANNDWHLTGNTGTSAATNFIGTIDNVDFVTRTNNTEKMRVMSGGNVGIGTAAPSTILHVNAAAADAIVRVETPTNVNESRIEFWKWAGIYGAGVGFYPGNADLRMRTLSNAALVFEPNSVERMRVTPNGNVGIGTTIPDASALLDVTSTSTGVLFPRIALTATNTAGPTTLPATSLLVYNTATAGVAPNNVTPGYYYNAGTGVAPNWVRFGAASNDWTLLGNAGTNAATNFVGTTDNVDFVTRTNNIQRTRIINDGRMKIGSGTNFAYGLSRLEIEGEGLQAHISYVSDYPSFIMMRHNGTIAAPTSLANNDNVGELRWYGHNGTTYMQTARILSYVDGAPTPTSVPGNLRFMTNTAGNNLTDEKMIIKNNGDVGIGTASIGSPLAKLHVFATGANWNTATSNGDFYVGDATYRFKMGVATGGGGAGDVRLTANGGTNRLFLGGGTNTNVAVVDGTNQRVGVNTFDPNTGLDVVGDIALKTTAATLTGTAPNFAVNTTTTPRSYYRVSSPTANFNILSLNNPANAGGTGTVDGRVVTLYNATAFTMTLSNQNVGATAAERIITGTGANLTINAGGSVTFVYNTTDSRWVVKDYANAGGGNDWTLLGNAGTNAVTNFIGTTDNVDFVTRTNNTEVMRATNAQRIGIGVTAPTAKLEVNSGTADGIYGHSNNTGGYLGYETNFSFGVAAQNILGAGVWASNPAAGYTSLYSQSTGTATVAAAIHYSNVWMAAYNLVDNASNTFNPSTSYNQLNVTNTTLGGTQVALRGYSIRGTTAGNPGYTVGVEGTADAQNQDAIGVEGTSYTNAAVSAGGYFEGLNFTGISWAYAYVGGTINGATARKIVGTGTVSEIVPTPNHGRVTLTCPESPEYWYQDYGTVAFVEGFAHVELDPILVEIIMSDEKNPIRVFPTPVDMPEFNGVSVTNRTATGFDLVELNGGKHSGSIDYQIVVKPKTNYGEGRFPQAPGPAWLKADKEPQAAKAANQPKKENVFHWQADHEVYNYNPEDVTPVGEMVRAGKYAGMYKLGDGTYSRNLPANKDDLKIPVTNK